MTSSILLTATSHRRNVLHLYKAILKLHRSLPQDLKVLGDKYVRDEFQRHKAAGSADQIQRFMLEWTDYAVTLSRQLSTTALLRQIPLGTPISPDKLDAFSDEQIFQLNELRLQAAADEHSVLPSEDHLPPKS